MLLLHTYTHAGYVITTYIYIYTLHALEIEPTRACVATSRVCLHFSTCARHPCAGAMPFFPVSFQCERTYVYVYMCMCMYVCVYVCIYIYIYIYPRMESLRRRASKKLCCSHVSLNMLQSPEKCEMKLMKIDI